MQSAAREAREELRAGGYWDEQPTWTQFSSRGGGKRNAEAAIIKRVKALGIWD